MNFLLSPRSIEREIKNVENAILSLEGTHLSLMGLKLTHLPSFTFKKHNGHEIVNYITSIDASVNKLMYRYIYLYVFLSITKLIYIILF